MGKDASIGQSQFGGPRGSSGLDAGPDGLTLFVGDRHGALAQHEDVGASSWAFDVAASGFVGAWSVARSAARSSMAVVHQNPGEDVGGLIVSYPETPAGGSLAHAGFPGASGPLPGDVDVVTDLHGPVFDDSTPAGAGCMVFSPASEPETVTPMRITWSVVQPELFSTHLMPWEPMFAVASISPDDPDHWMF